MTGPSTEDVRVGGMPAGVLRPVKTGDPALVPVESVRKSHEDQGLSEATSRPGLIAAGVSLAIIAAVNGLGTKLNAKFTSINASLH